MMSILDRLRALCFDRRAEGEALPPEDDRRTKISLKSADANIHSAIDRLEETLQMKRSDFFNKEVANDIQDTVQFSTFQAICPYKVRNGVFHKCRNELHEDAGSGIAKCSEEECPVMRGKTKEQGTG